MGPRSEGDRPRPLAVRPVELWRPDPGGREDVGVFPPFDGVELDDGGLLLTLAIVFFLAFEDIDHKGIPRLIKKQRRSIQYGLRNIM